MMFGAPAGSVPTGSAYSFAKAVSEALPPHSAFVSFVRFRQPGRDWLMPAQDPNAVPHYAAVVHDGRGVYAINLGLADPIEQALDRAIALPDRRPALLEEPTAVEVDRWKALYDVLWRPLEEHLIGVRVVIVSQDGGLGRVPLAALHDGKHWLQERWDVAYVRSAQDLIRPRTPSSDDPTRGGPPLILADPTVPPTPPYVDLSSFRPLAAALEEGRALAKLLPGSVLLEGPAAEERALMTARAPRIVHVAGHGFLLPLEELKPRVPFSLVRSLAPREGRTLNLTRNQDELWMRSGLLLATTPPSPPVSSAGPWDGLATAYEIMTADMRGTEIVTLSACETGVGQVYGRSGLASLQSAFLNAGADSVVAALWRIDSRSTVTWMETFYRNLLAGKSRLEAQRAATVRTRTDYPHPYHWAPFVLMGERGALRSLRPTAR